jgi:hypothetical protein
MLPNAANNGGTWKEHNVSVEQVTRRNESMGTGSQAIWDHAKTWIEQAHLSGLIHSEAGQS